MSSDASASRVTDEDRQRPRDALNARERRGRRDRGPIQVVLVLEFRNIPGSGAQEPGREGAERALNQLDQSTYQDLTSERPSINPESG